MSRHNDVMKKRGWEKSGLCVAVTPMNVRTAMSTHGLFICPHVALWLYCVQRPHLPIHLPYAVELQPASERETVRMLIPSSHAPPLLTKKRHFQARSPGAEMLPGHSLLGGVEQDRLKKGHRLHSAAR